MENSGVKCAGKKSFDVGKGGDWWLGLDTTIGHVRQVELSYNLFSLKNTIEIGSFTKNVWIGRNTLTSSTFWHQQLSTPQEIARQLSWFSGIPTGVGWSRDSNLDLLSTKSTQWAHGFFGGGYQLSQSLFAWLKLRLVLHGSILTLAEKLLLQLNIAWGWKFGMG